MSRLGKLPITIPTGVQVQIKPDSLVIKGPKGEIIQPLPQSIEVKQEDSELKLSIKGVVTNKNKALWGLARQLVANAVKGVYENFEKKLEISGIGYKAQVEGQDLVLNLGYSHPIRYKIPAGLSVSVDKNTITLVGVSKQLVGQTAAEIRSLRPPEPYKGKGIKYADEVVRRKAGKVVKSAGAK